MNPEMIRPSAELSKLVNGYLLLKKTGDDPNPSSCDLPEGNIAIVFNLAKNRSILKTTDNLYLPDFFIVPAENNNFQIDILSVAELFIVLCNPAVFYRIFKLSPEEHYNQKYFSSDIFDGYPMIKTLREITQMRERIGFFENFILHNTPLRNFRMNFEQHENKNQNKETEITIQELFYTMKFDNLPLKSSFYLSSNFLF
jgi:hypothetical protein